MRSVPLLILALVCSSGCFALDEIEKGQAIMAEHSPDSDDSGSGAAGSDGTPKSARERLSEYYAKQRARAAASVKKDEPTEAVGACEIRGQVKFMHRSECALRGGTFR